MIPFLQFHSDSILQLRLRGLLTSYQTGMLGNNRPGHSEESSSARLAGELALGANVEESPVASDEVVCDASGLVENVDLAVENVLGLLVVVGGDVAGGARLDAVEAGGQVTR